MGNVTRTIKKAYVSYERVFKEDGKIETDYGDITLFNCNTREKAEIMLQKEFKDSFVTILEIKFVQETRGMNVQTFLEHSEVIKSEDVSEKEMAAKAESIKRNK
jgi:hypothetical protein